MPKSTLLIIGHQVVFQAMFLIKNIYLQHKTGKSIRGKNTEANYSILFFTAFISCSVLLSFFKSPIGTIQYVDPFTAALLSLPLILSNLVIGAASLLNMKDSWRVGIIESQRTPLVEHGIYRFSRNPYFLSYLLMFGAYTVLLQNIILLGLSIIGFILIHSMINTEEEYLQSIHGEAYVQYKLRVPKYFIR